MEPNNNEENEHKPRPFAAGVVAIAAFSLLAGASVSAALVDYAAPEFAEEDPFAGAVDDLTGEDTWEEKDSERTKKGPRGLVGQLMKSRINNLMEDREEHLEKRIEVNTNLITAFQYCIDSTDCDADEESLLEMIERLTFAVQGMQAKLNNVEPTHNDDQEDWKSWDERKSWDEDDRITFAEERFLRLTSAHIAISFCIGNEDCSADAETLETVLTHMTDRANHLRECVDERRCDRDHDQRKGVHARMRGTFCKVTDNCEDREKKVPPFAFSQVECEKYGGSWEEAPDRGEGFFYCDWSDKGSDDRSEDGSDNGADNQEECEASGGTWYDDRRYCDTE